MSVGQPPAWMPGQPPPGGWSADQVKQFIEAILREQRQAIVTADAEREKAAQVMRDSLLAQIVSGDAALERHISEQVRQIRQLIEMGNKQTEMAFTASEKAILKAETANERRFESVNEFRGQLSDQTATFMPRELSEQRWLDTNKKVEALSQFQARILGALAFVGVLVPLLTALAVYLLTRHGISVQPTQGGTP